MAGRHSSMEGYLIFNKIMQVLLAQLVFVIISMLQKILFSNFLGSGRQNSSGLNDLLDKTDSLLRLLEEQSFISQFKAGTQRVRQYMTYQKFIELTELITVVGDEWDKKRSYKFPLVACEMLVSDNSKIQEYFLPQDGVVVVQEKVTHSVEKEVEQEVDDDDDQEEEKEQKKEEDKVEENKEEKGEEGEKTAEEGEKTAEEGEQKPKQKAEGADEQFGEFVGAVEKKKKIVKVKEVVEEVEIIQKELPPLLDKLLEYFSQPINYTLTAYVSKVMVNLLNRKTATFLSRFFSNEEDSHKIFDSIFEHLGSRSVVDLLTRIFTIENSSYIEARYNIFVRMVEYLSKTSKIDNLSNTVACVGQIYEKLTAHSKIIGPVKELQIYVSKIPELLKKLLEFALGDNELTASYSISVICQLLSNCNLIQQAEKLKEWFESYVDGAVIKLQKYEKEDRPRLGVVGFRLLETFNICLKVEGHRSLFTRNKELFPTLIGLVKKYPLNNIFHNEVFKLLTTTLSFPHNEASQHLIDKDNLLQWLEEEAEHEQAKAANPNKYSKKGYYGHIFNILLLLQENKQKHPEIDSFIKDERFNNIKTILIDREAEYQQRMLGGLAKKQMSHAIMHDKESILAAHATFLASAPAPVMPQDLEDPIYDPILLEELQKQLDGVQIVNETAPPAVIEEEHHKAELIEENQHHKNAFWKMHLDYDVDGLMQDMM